MSTSRRAHALRLGSMALAVVCTVSACTPGDAPPASGSAVSSPGSSGATSSSTASASPSLSGPTTPVPPPTPGNISQTVATVEPSVLPKVAISATASPAKGVSVRLADIKAINAVSHIPGDVNGAAVQLSVEIANGKNAPLDVSSVEVRVTDSSGDLGVPVTTESTSPFSGQIAAGARGTGVYVFRVPTARRGSALVTVSYRAGGPVAQFAGKL